MSNITTKWPPTEEQIQNIATSALNKSQDKDVKVLVYWENDPGLMILDPFHFADTKYIEQNKKSIYSKIKLKAEKKLYYFCKKNNIPIFIHRFPAINSRQSISVSNLSNPNLFEYLGKNKKYINQIFPVKV